MELEHKRMRSYRYQRRLHWSECDPAGIIFFPHYARWMVDGLNEMLLSLGIDPNAAHSETARGGLPVVQLSMQFHDAPVLNAHLWHEITVEKIGGKSLSFVHRFLRGETLLMEARETRVWATHVIGNSASMRAESVPNVVRILLEGDEANSLEVQE
ncbi:MULTISPECIES: acyl-CoA thioesterase [unclassified Burkholderia]|uniref:acyl-CoA thioesterase n=1 Tax=unclassified Burkholderia TaxID=2613784 RepID=UPI002AB00335|nr:MULTISPECIES: thioesterase family protein [unclassified Burkholderia]